MLYPLSIEETSDLKKFIKENKVKGYIQNSASSIASLFFFVSKKDRTKWPVENYRMLNKRTIKNAYSVPFISSLIDRPKEATIFIKLDLQAGFNNICIRKGDEWKAAFNTSEGLFEPTVMFFELCNALATF